MPAVGVAIARLVELPHQTNGLEVQRQTTLTSPAPNVETFLARWRTSGAAERANYQLFLTELCTLLGVPGPEPTQPDDTLNAYVFERTVTFQHGDGSVSSGFIDLYNRGCFVLEAKQGAAPRLAQPALSGTVQTTRRGSKKGTALRGSAAWDEAMLRARAQAEQYARALPATEGRPPFLVVVDVGHSLELYAEFTCTGGTYVPFPDPRHHRIALEQLRDEVVRDTLRLLWTDPLALDPARRSAKVTRDIAQKLGRLAQSLEQTSHTPAAVASFLMRCLFTMFAEDMGLLPKQSFFHLLTALRVDISGFVPMVEELWTRMNEGGFSTVLRQKVMRFNGGLFQQAQALPLTQDQFELLIEAARADWRDVEPAIFGTLLERALDPRERQKLGAHYTPRAYVEQLVLPTVVNPLRTEWDAVKVAAVALDHQGHVDEAVKEVTTFHRRLCHVLVLDPACGTGNFLYVTMEHLKRLEGEVLLTLEDLGQGQAPLALESFTVRPHQFLGLEVNPRAAAIAELVLWIGHLQWHFRTHGSVMPAEPVIGNDKNIECRDALLAWDEARPALGPDGRSLTRWDGRTFKKHPATGQAVPDEDVRVATLSYVNARAATWPKADFIVGNPPFLGAARMRDALGDGYAEAVRRAHAEVPESADFVMYWWNHAARLVRERSVLRFGFIATNSLRQTFNRRVTEAHLGAVDSLSLVFAVPDHPWVDSQDGAAVRISMTVAERGVRDGLLKRVIEETRRTGDGADIGFTDHQGKIHADLTIGPDVAGTAVLSANLGLSCPGVKLHGAGFIVTPDQAAALGLGRVPGLERHIRPYRNGKDLAAIPRDVMVIDLFGLSAQEVLDRFPEVYQWVHDRVKPERDARANSKDGAGYAKWWWLFGKPRQQLRSALVDLRRYVATVETSKHRFFTFLDATVLPDNRLICVAHADAFVLGVLSSRVHTTWALAAGSTLEDRPVYAKTNCFDKFPFPDCAPLQKARIRGLAKALDAHRKRQQAQHPKLTLTETYNLLEKLRSGEALSVKDQTIHGQGLVSVLRQLHDDLDTTVQAAYGWENDPMADGVILERLVALNQERAAEEQRGTIRWLRPEFQNPAGAQAVASPDQKELDLLTITLPAVADLHPWPQTLSAQAQALRSMLVAYPGPMAPDAILACFPGARQDRVTELLEALVTLGQARLLPDGQLAA